MMKKLICFSLMIALFIPLGRGKEAKNAWAMWKNAFQRFEDAELAYLNGKAKIAKENFKDALREFQKVNKEFPDWNPKLVAYRIGLCKRRIDAITERMNDPTFPTAPSAPAATPPPPPTPLDVEQPTVETTPSATPASPLSSITASVAAMEKQLRELREYKTKYQASQHELDLLKQEAIRGQAALDQVKQLMKEKNTLQQRHSLTLLELEKAKKQAQASEQVAVWKNRFEDERLNSEALKNEFKNLLVDNSKLQKAKDAAVKQKNQAEFDYKNSLSVINELKDKITNLNQNLTDHSKRTDDINARFEKLKQDQALLTQQLAQKELEKKELNQKLEESLSKSNLSDDAKKIQAENVRLREELGNLQLLIKKNQTSLDKALAALKVKSEELEKLNSVMGKMNTQNGSFEKELYFYKSKFAKAETTARSQKENIKRLEDKNKKLEDDLIAIGSAYEKTREKNKQVDSLLKQLAEQKKTNEELTLKITDLQETSKQIQTLTQKLAETKKNNDELLRKTKQFEQTNRQVEALNKQLEESKKNFDNLSKKLKDYDKAKQQITELSKQLADAREKQANLDKTLNQSQEATRQLASLKQQLESLRQNHDAALAKTRQASAQEVAELKAIIDDQAKETAKLKESLQKVGEASPEKIEQELQKRIEQRLAEKEKMITDLRSELNAAKDLKARVDSLNKALVQAREEVAKTKEAAEKEKTDQIEESKKELVLKDQIITDLEKKLEHSQVTSKDNKIIENKLRNNERQIASLSKEFAKEKQRLLKQIEEKDKKLQEMKKNLTASANHSALSEPINNYSEKQLDSGFKNKMDREIVTFLLSSAEQAEKEKNLDSVIWHYRKIISVTPDNTDVLKKLGALYAKKNDSKNALEYYEKASRTAPEDVETLTILGELYIDLGKPELAVSALTRALPKSQKDAKTHQLLGTACDKMGWKETAEKELRTAVALAPASPEANLILATFLYERYPHKREEAQKFYAKSKRFGAKPVPELEKQLEKATPPGAPLP